MIIKKKHSLYNGLNRNVVYSCIQISKVLIKATTVGFWMSIQEAGIMPERIGRARL